MSKQDILTIATATPVALPAQDTYTDTLVEEIPKVQPPYGVIVHNDDYNGMDFVIGVFQKVFHYPTEKAITLMLEVHYKGRSLVWSGSREVAEFKADQIRSCGPDPDGKQKGATTLRVTIEPLSE